MPTTTDAVPHVLVQGRLHWSFVLLAVLRAFRRFLIFVLAIGLQAVASDEPLIRLLSVAGVVGVGLLMGVGPLIEWLRFRYRLTAKELTVTSGLLRLHERRIPVGRVQDLTTEVGPLHRLFGTVKVTVQTSSTEGAEATLDGLTRSDATALSEALRSITRPSPSSEAVESAEEPSLARSTPIRLVLRGLTDNRAGVLLATGLGVLDQLVGDDVRVYQTALGFLRDRLNLAFGSGGASLAASIAAVALVFALAGYVTSAVINVLLFGGFRLTERDGVFLRRYGLITRRAHSLPRHRIQAVRIEQNIGRRLLGLAEMKTDDMGSGAHDKSAEGSGTHVFVPIARLDESLALVERVLTDFSSAAIDWQPISRRVVRRWITRGAVVAVIASVPLLWTQGPLGLVALALVAPAALWGGVVYRSVGWSVDARFFTVRWGVVRRRMAVVPVGRVQGASVRSTPFDRLNGVATLTVIVGGGAQVSLGHLPSSAAHRVAAQLAGDASSTS